ncbi:hypothetical protein BS47DRAFT_163120 [Hydnum rufescens UP504]|uniref:Uncharacterized protein n=1 Tax=Hydnum rufescens UP504 TaxID=1448309 RepID=A0A9P6B7V1_9AGAM|nr:hypothetical protein BS47DRAFT_163120 [Hydnum rufescens UP504]
MWREPKTCPGFNITSASSGNNQTQTCDIDVTCVLHEAVTCLQRMGGYPLENTNAVLVSWKTRIPLSNVSSLRSTLFEVEQITACSRFFLSKIWHWERDGGFRHEGLTFEFIRHDRATVCIKVDRLSYDNDPYTSTVKAFNLSGADILAESRDQDSETSLLKAKDWMQILTRNECASFFHPSPPSNRPHLSMKSLGTTTFSNAERSDPPPTLIDVMLVVGAVSKAREEYHLWQANCWWLARSVRGCIERQWSQESDSRIPDITIAGFDARMERIARDQDKIWHHYKELDSRRVSECGFSR